MHRIVSFSSTLLKNGIVSFIIRQVYIASKGQPGGQPEWYSIWEWAGEDGGWADRKWLMTVVTWNNITTFLKLSFI